MEVELFNKRFILSFNFILNLPFILLFNPYRKSEFIFIDNTKYKMYIADNFISQCIGYRFRSPDDLEENEIMLFKFKKEKEYTFWMKNVHFSIKLCSINFDDNSLSNCLIMQSKNCCKYKISGKNIIEFPLFTNERFNNS